MKVVTEAVANEKTENKMLLKFIVPVQVEKSTEKQIKKEKEVPLPQECELSAMRDELQEITRCNS